MSKESKLTTGEGEWNQSKRAEAVLDHILQGKTTTEEKSAELTETGVDIDKAIHDRPVLDRETGRNKSRLAVFTTDVSVLENGSILRSEYLAWSNLFDELHVMVLVTGKGNDGFERASRNTWFYKVHAPSEDVIPKSTLYAAWDALTFIDIVRPDIILGIDPFAAGEAAYKVAASFGRPLQIHIKTDFLDPSFRKRNKTNDARYKKAVKLMRKVASVRTSTDKLKKNLGRRFKGIIDIKTLPRFYNFTGLIKAEPQFNLREKYPDWLFIMLAFGPLTADSHLHTLFSALRRTLLNNRIGLIVFGDGPMRENFKEKVKLLGIEKSVVFEQNLTDPVSYLKGADVLVQTDTTDDSEVIVLQSAASGLPLIGFSTELREDLFEDERSAFLCPAGDLQCLSQKTNKFINTLSIRKQFSDLSVLMAQNRLHEDKQGYYQSLQNTIESILFTK